MSQRNHDPTDSGMPACSTTGSLQETLEQLRKDEFLILIDFGGETDGREAIQSG